MPTKQNDFRRHAVRLASRIHEHLLGPAHARRLPPLPQATWQNVCQLCQRFEHVSQRGWHTAAKTLQYDVFYSVGRLQRELEDLQSQSFLDHTPDLVASPRDIMGDLLALRDEFDEFQIDFEEGTLTAVTDPIIFDRHDLGSFQIVLHWAQIGKSRPYFTVPSDPYRPEGDADVSHPHVREDVLCEGEGAASIRAALRSGRLLDFFTLVRQILETYNADSAYVTLDRWSGVACRDCAFRMSTEDHGTCERCDAPLCEDCMSHCLGCDQYVCSGCRSDCSACGDSCCHGCLEFSPHDQGRYCPTCLKERQHSPPGDDLDEAIDNPAPEGQEGPAAAAADAVRVGQAPCAA